MKVYSEIEILELVEEKVNEAFWEIEDENGWCSELDLEDFIALTEPQTQIAKIMKKWHDKMQNKEVKK